MTLVAISLRTRGLQQRPHEIAKIDEASDHFLSQPASRGIGVSLGGKRVHRSSLSVWSVPLFTIEETQERDQLARQGQGWALVRSLSSVLGPIVFWRIVSALDKVASLTYNGLMLLLLLYLYTSQSVSQSPGESDWSC
jgi:hypothetical protein